MDAWRGRGKWIVMALGTTTIAALVVAVPGAWRRFREENLISKLSSGTGEERRCAAQAAAELHVARAAPELARIACKLQNDYVPEGDEGLPRPDFFACTPYKLSDQEWEQNWALQSLLELGQDAIPHLLRRLESAPEEHLFLGLACFGDDARPAVPALLRWLGHPDRNVREWAIKSLFHAKPSVEEALASLTERLRDESPLVRSWAVKLLSRFGPKSRPAATQIGSLLEDRDPRLALAAAGVLVAMHEETGRALALLKTFVASHEEHTSSSAFDVAAELLGDIGPDAIEALPLLEKGLACSWESCRTNAAYALWRIEGPRSRGREAMLARIGELGYYYTFRSLGKLGVQAREAAPLLEKLLAEAGDGFECVGAAQALWKVTGDVSEALPVLRRALGRVESIAAYADEAAKALGEMGPAAREAVPDLELALEVGSRRLRLAAREALKKIRGEPEPRAAP